MGPSQDKIRERKYLGVYPTHHTLGSLLHVSHFFYFASIMLCLIPEGFSCADEMGVRVKKQDENAPWRKLEEEETWTREDVRNVLDWKSEKSHKQKRNR